MFWWRLRHLDSERFISNASQNLNSTFLLLGGQESNVVSVIVDIHLTFLSLLCNLKSCQRHFKVKLISLLVNIFYGEMVNQIPEEVHIRHCILL